jgi:hypothetical protein
MHTGRKYNTTGAVMVGGKLCTAAAVLSLALGMGGCDTATNLAYRWGPDPAMPASHIDPVLDNQITVLGYIECRAGLGMTVPTTDPACLTQPALTTVPQAHFAEVARWGYNVGRQDCEVYMNVLFKLNREKGRNHSIIAQLAASSAAIVSATASSPATTLSVLAAVFGLVTVVNDAYFETYLFSSAPGLVSKKVHDLQVAYAADQAAPQTPAQAYAAIQGYYQICLPDAIEGVFTQTIADGQPVAIKPTGVAGPSALRAGTARSFSGRIMRLEH